MAEITIFCYPNYLNGFGKICRANVVVVNF